MIVVLSRARKVLNCIQFLFFLHYLVFIKPHLQVLLKLNGVCAAHGWLYRAQRVPFYIESEQVRQQCQSRVQVVDVVVRNSQRLQRV